MKSKLLNKTKVLIRSISVLELLIALFILAALIYVVTQVKSNKQLVKVEVKISSSSWWNRSNLPPPFWLGESIKVGDQEYNSSGTKVAEVLEVRAYELNSVNNGGGTTRKDFYLTLNLLVKKNKQTQKLGFKDKPLEIGAPIELNLSNTLVRGLVTFIEGTTDTNPTKEILIEGVWQDAQPWEAEVVHINGKMEDEFGNVTAIILDKKVELARKTVETADGRLVIGRDPLRRDVYLTIKLQVKKQGASLYFREDQKVKIGELLFIQLAQVDIKNLSIIKIIEEQ